MAKNHNLDDVFFVVRKKDGEFIWIGGEVSPGICVGFAFGTTGDAEKFRIRYAIENDIPPDDLDIITSSPA